MRFVSGFLILVSAIAFGTQKPVQSSPVKVFVGPEGETVTMVEVNKAKEMLVHLKNVGVQGDEFEDQTHLYLLKDTGAHGRQAYLNKKRGSKTYEYILLTETSGHWVLSHPIKATANLPLHYSREESAKTNFETVLKSYQPKTETK